MFQLSLITKNFPTIHEKSIENIFLHIKKHTSKINLKSFMI